MMGRFFTDLPQNNCKLNSVDLLTLRLWSFKSFISKKERKKVAILKLKTIHSIIITSEIFIPSNTQGVLGTKKDKFIVHIHDKMSQLPPSGGDALCVKMRNVTQCSIFGINFFSRYPRDDACCHVTPCCENNLKMF